MVSTPEEFSSLEVEGTVNGMSPVRVRVPFSVGSHVTEGRDVQIREAEGFYTIESQTIAILRIVGTNQ